MHMTRLQPRIVQIAPKSQWLFHGLITGLFRDDLSAKGLSVRYLACRNKEQSTRRRHSNKMNW
jgi:hypothetical protein